MTEQNIFKKTVFLPYYLDILRLEALAAGHHQLEPAVPHLGDSGGLAQRVLLHLGDMPQWNEEVLVLWVGVNNLVNTSVIKGEKN